MKQQKQISLCFLCSTHATILTNPFPRWWVSFGQSIICKTISFTCHCKCDAIIVFDSFNWWFLNKLIDNCLRADNNEGAGHPVTKGMSSWCLKIVKQTLLQFRFGVHWDHLTWPGGWSVVGQSFPGHSVKVEWSFALLAKTDAAWKKLCLSVIIVDSDMWVVALSFLSFSWPVKAISAAKHNTSQHVSLIDMRTMRECASQHKWHWHQFTTAHGVPGINELILQWLKPFHLASIKPFSTCLNCNHFNWIPPNGIKWNQMSKPEHFWHGLTWNQIIRFQVFSTSFT